MPLDAEPFAEKKFLTVNGRRMAYIDEGKGDAIVFLHGNPTSSYLWRNVMPHAGAARPLIAPRPDRHGRLREARRRRPGTLSLRRTPRLSRRPLGSAGGAATASRWCCMIGARRWASNGPAATASRAGLAYMEAIVRPLDMAGMAGARAPEFQDFRSPAGEEMVLEKNVFVERVLPSSIIRLLSEDGDGRIPPALRGSRRGPPPDPELAAADPYRGRARRCGADRGRGYGEWLSGS